MLVGQVVFAGVLAVIAGLYSKSLQSMMAADVEYPTDNILLARVGEDSPAIESVFEFATDLMVVLNAMPGVRSASFGTHDLRINPFFRGNGSGMMRYRDSRKTMPSGHSRPGSRESILRHSRFPSCRAGRSPSRVSSRKTSS